MEPRSFTRNSLSNILEFDLGRENTEYEWIWLTLLHFSSIVCFIPLSLAIWSARESESHKVDQQGRAVLNFQITVILMLFSLALALMVIPTFLMMLRLPQDASGTLFGIAPVLILLISLFTTYQGSVNLYRAITEKQIHYPLSILFVK